MQIEENEGRPGWVSPWWAGPGKRAGALDKLREGGQIMIIRTHFKFELEANFSQEVREKNHL